MAVVRYEYDPDFDIDVPIDDPSDGTGPNYLGWKIDDASVLKVSLALRWALGDWVVGMSVMDLIGVGLLSGLLLAMPLALLIRSSVNDAPRPVDAPSTESARAPTLAPTTIPSEPRPFMGPPAPEQVVDTPSLATTAPPDDPNPASEDPAEPVAVVSLPGGMAEAFKQLIPAPSVPALVENARDGVEEPIAAIEMPKPVIGMKAVMDGVRRTAWSKDWRRSGLADPELMRSVDLILWELRQATGDPNLTLPVRFGEVSPEFGDKRTGVLHVAVGPAAFDRNIRVPSPTVLNAGWASRSILIADGDIVLSVASDCLIVATGAVEVSRSTRCVIIAGRLIQAISDTASVLISGSRLRVSSSGVPNRPLRRAAIYSAPDLVDVTHAEGAIFLNSENQRISLRSDCRSLGWPALDFDDADRAAPTIGWEGRIAPVLGSWSPSDGGFELRVEGVDGTVHVEIGAPILDPSGRPVPELVGWRAYRSTMQYAMLFKNDEFMVAPLGLMYGGGMMDLGELMGPGGM